MEKIGQFEVKFLNFFLGIQYLRLPKLPVQALQIRRVDKWSLPGKMYRAVNVQIKSQAAMKVHPS